MASTRGSDFLKKQGIEFSILTYEHQVKGAQYAAQQTGIPLERMIKTLVVSFEGGGNAFALMPGSQNLSLKKLAKAAGAKAASMVDPKDAERITGYQVGGISPFGSRRSLDVYLDERLAAFEKVCINGGGRGAIVELKTSDLVRLLKPTVVDLDAEER
jgi:Cys-tRNA(Pro)/Cys-tRNA(Cys) deacylase